MRAMQTKPVGTQVINLLGSLLPQKRRLEITERLFKSGNDSELDLQQAKSQYLGTLATIPQQEGNLRQSQNASRILLARPGAVI
jgi:outer membrane protein TolC